MGQAPAKLPPSLAPTPFLAGRLRYSSANIAGYAVGDTIELIGTTATGAKFSASSIIVSLSGGGTLTPTTTSALTGTIKVTGDGHGDSLLASKSTATAAPQAAGFANPLDTPAAPTAARQETGTATDQSHVPVVDWLVAIFHTH